MGLFSRHSAAVLLVCSANICRSPMAEGMLRSELNQRGLKRQVKVDSAGTHAANPGRAADPRALRACARKGIDLRKCRARQVTDRDFQEFDYILAMDEPTCRWLLKVCPEDYRDRVSLLGSWVEGRGAIEIPDPYYGNVAGFERVFSQLREAIDGFLNQASNIVQAKSEDLRTSQ